MCFRTFVFMGVWMFSERMLASLVACVFCWMKWDFPTFYPFYVDK
jgi:hypothetical protein